MDPFIVAALIGAVPASVAAVASWRGSRRQQAEVRQALRDVQQQVSNVHVSIGQPNGQGNVTQMLENLIEWKGAHTEEHRHLEDQRQGGK